MFRKLIYSVLFIIALIIYIRQRFHLPLPAVVNNYVNDFLYLPLLLGAIEYVIRRLKKDSTFKLPIAFILFLACCYSFYFEYYLPRVNPRYTADWIDVILYFLGGFAYFFSQKMENRRFSE
ncbi:hypothetical protein [Flavobacterium sandaracinum]|uniref:Magnesium citrate secondary transporter n=1 Tax=Flavobacterium sandaracinum TaxID=2541733 RepID=A0A4R5CYQ1_9FLAO|nr:hypothetical protein [Flavobacterium sandaracinum]TDE06012.1 hypothetical protein E0F91_05385 [Flavobacterium sandaracinum]